MRILFSTAGAMLLAAAFISVGSAAQTCEFHVGPVWIELNGTAQSGIVNVETQPGCAWSVDSSVDWIHPGAAGGSGSGIIPYQVDATEAWIPLRQGAIRVRWNTVTAGQNAIVTQSSRRCSASFSPSAGPTSALTLGWRGGSHTFEVLADPPFSGPWRVTSAPDWITFTRPPVGILGGGDGATLFVAAPNASASARDGAVTFCSGQTFVLHQAGRTARGGNAVPADVDGDGIADPVVYRPSTGTWFALRSSSAYSYGDILQVPWGTAGMIPMPGDFDGDNKMELAVYEPNGTFFGTTPAGNWNLLYSSNQYSAGTQTSFPFPLDYQNYTPHNVPLMADFNGDGRADFVTWRPDTAEWSVSPTDSRIPTRLPENFLSRGEYNGHIQWGLPGDIPVSADFDGDRLADLAVWRPSNGTWYIRRSSDHYSFATAQTYQWGLPGDQPIVGDFDGDGRADLIVWRPDEGNWYIAYSSRGYNPVLSVRIQWGLPGDIPVANDYDGDGNLDPAVWRPSNGTWYLLMSSEGYSYATARAIQWGLPGDVPLSGRITRSQ